MAQPSATLHAMWCPVLLGAMAGLLASLLMHTPHTVTSAHAVPAVGTLRVPTAMSLLPVRPGAVGPRSGPSEFASHRVHGVVHASQESGADMETSHHPGLLLSIGIAAVALGATLLRRSPARSDSPWVMAAAGRGFGPAKPPKVKKEKAAAKEEELCTCGSGLTYADCCQPYHLNKKYPETPEALLRARYSGYVNAKKEFIRETTDLEAHLKLTGKTNNQFIEDVVLSCKNLVYEKLVILKEEPGEKEDEYYITFRFWFKFIAEFSGTQKGVTRRAVETGDRFTRTERSLFRKVNDKWLFVDSDSSSEESFELGDTSLVQTNLLLKAKDVVSSVGQKAAETLLPQKEVQVQTE